ncbi:hypothetical protein FB565_003456 [Actinoplanes lutulentus]|uniref:DUF6545 domain-containing protein n=1 Tax=Actinoplanes lutulentus TaxID=1287878 RepID=A0A327Z2E0_9ACTN|nr:hypothetical protein [Actinoplanes lutulentus]RAK29269.1 hypothetical protein B0I29_11861 [Actinoplanes lutulentus]
MIAAASVAALFWVAVLARLPSLLDPRRRVLCANLLACALAITVALPAVAAGRPAPVAAHLLAIVAAHLLLRFVSLITATGHGRFQSALTGGVLVLLTIEASGRVLSAAPRITENTAYWVTFEAYLAVVLLLGARACVIIGRAAPAGLLRRGLLTMAAGILLIFGYASTKAILVATAPWQSAAWEPWLVGLRSAGAVLYVAGGAVPAAARLGTVLRAYRMLLILRPLWSAMRDAFPEVVLMRPARAALEMTGEAGVRLRLYRRVIEIRDGLLALRPYLVLPDLVLPDADGCTDPAAAEARRIAGALRRRADGEPPAAAPGRWAHVGPEMADEIAWLSRVSQAFRHRSGCSDSQTCRIASVIASRPSGDTSAARSAISVTPASRSDRSNAS